MSDLINIVFASDNNYAQHTSVAMASILRTTPDISRVRFFLISDNISVEIKEKICQTVKKMGSEVFFIDMHDARMDEYFISGQISRTAYCRLDMAHLLPQSVKKVIYLDCDLLVKDDIAKLWDIDMEGFPVAAVADLGIMASARSRKQKHNQLGFAYNEDYFNSGVMIFDLEQWREAGYAERVKSLAREHNYVHHDQDALNVLFKGNWKHIPLRWNVIPPIYNLFVKIIINRKYRNMAIAARQDIAIMHYAGGYKPWEYDVNYGFNDYYYNCLEYTEFKDVKMPQMDKRRKHRSILRQMVRLKIADFWQWLFG